MWIKGRERETSSKSSFSFKLCAIEFRLAFKFGAREISSIMKLGAREISIFFKFTVKVCRSFKFTPCEQYFFFKDTSCECTFTFKRMVDYFQNEDGLFSEILSITFSSTLMVFNVILVMKYTEFATVCPNFFFTSKTIRQIIGRLILILTGSQFYRVS
jgi:hypothetical protein